MDNQEEITFSKSIFSIFVEIKKYLEIRYEITKLDFTEKLILLSTILITSGIVAILILSFLLFLSFSLAFYLGALWQSNFEGFLAVAGIYFVLILFVLLIKEKIIKKMVTKGILNTVLGNKKKKK